MRERQRRIVMSSRRIAAVAAVTVVVAACGSTSTSPAHTPSTTTTLAARTPLVVPLGIQPSGTVTFTWNPDSEQVSATVRMVGLTPGSSHAMDIDNGTCTAPGNVVIQFPDVTADISGAINTTVTSPHPGHALPATRMSLNIHLASVAQLESPDGSTPISCADIAAAASRTVTMAPPPNTHRQGSATLTYDPVGKTLSVTVMARGLAPGSDHAVRIHAGSCESQGALKYELSDLEAYSSSAASATTMIPNVEEAPPPSGWYVEVHLGSPSQIKQNDEPTLYFEPIMCGDIGR
jgi:hypothetical protein